MHLRSAFTEEIPVTTIGSANNARSSKCLVLKQERSVANPTGGSAVTIPHCLTEIERDELEVSSILKRLTVDSWHLQISFGTYVTLNFRSVRTQMSALLECKSVFVKKKLTEVSQGLRTFEKSSLTRIECR